MSLLVAYVLGHILVLATESVESTSAAGYSTGAGRNEDLVPPTVRGQDIHAHCCYWAKQGECKTNAYYMRPYCQRSCGTTGCEVKTAASCLVTVNLENCPWQNEAPSGYDNNKRGDNNRGQQTSGSTTTGTWTNNIKKPGPNVRPYGSVPLRSYESGEASTRNGDISGALSTLSGSLSNTGSGPRKWGESFERPGTMPTRQNGGIPSKSYESGQALTTDSDLSGILSTLSGSLSSSGRFSTNSGSIASQEKPGGQLIRPVPPPHDDGQSSRPYNSSPGKPATRPYPNGQSHTRPGVQPIRPITGRGSPSGAPSVRPQNGYSSGVNKPIQSILKPNPQSVSRPRSQSFGTMAAESSQDTSNVNSTQYGPVRLSLSVNVDNPKLNTYVSGSQQINSQPSEEDKSQIDTNISGSPGSVRVTNLGGSGADHQQALGSRSNYAQPSENLEGGSNAGKSQYGKEQLEAYLGSVQGIPGSQILTPTILPDGKLPSGSYGTVSGGSSQDTSNINSTQYGPVRLSLSVNVDNPQLATYVSGSSETNAGSSDATLSPNEYESGISSSGAVQPSQTEDASGILSILSGARPTNEPSSPTWSAGGLSADPYGATNFNKGPTGGSGTPSILKPPVGKPFQPLPGIIPTNPLVGLRGPPVSPNEILPQLLSVLTGHLSAPGISGQIQKRITNIEDSLNKILATLSGSGVTTIDGNTRPTPLPYSQPFETEKPSGPMGVTTSVGMPPSEAPTGEDVQEILSMLSGAPLSNGDSVAADMGSIVSDITDALSTLSGAVSGAMDQLAGGSDDVVDALDALSGSPMAGNQDTGQSEEVTDTLSILSGSEGSPTTFSESQTGNDANNDAFDVLSVLAGAGDLSESIRGAAGEYKGPQQTGDAGAAASDVLSTLAGTVDSGDVRPDVPIKYDDVAQILSLLSGIISGNVPKPTENPNQHIANILGILSAAGNIDQGTSMSVPSVMIPVPQGPLGPQPRPYRPPTRSGYETPRVPNDGAPSGPPGYDTPKVPNSGTSSVSSGTGGSNFYPVAPSSGSFGGQPDIYSAPSSNNYATVNRAWEGKITRPAVRSPRGCRDFDVLCNFWTSKNECQRNSRFMEVHCPAACKFC